MDEKGKGGGGKDEKETKGEKVHHLDLIPFWDKVEVDASLSAFKALVDNAVRVQGYDRNGPVKTNDATVRKLANDALDMGKVFVQEARKRPLAEDEE